MQIKAMSLALILALFSSAALANPLSRSGVFILENEDNLSVPVVNQVDEGPRRKWDSPLSKLKHRAVTWARKKAVHLNTHPFVGNPDLPRKYHGILPHEVAIKLKESFLREIRQGRRSH